MKFRAIIFKLETERESQITTFLITSHLSNLHLTERHLNLKKVDPRSKKCELV